MRWSAAGQTTPCLLYATRRADVAVPRMISYTCCSCLALLCAEVAELADAQASGACGRKVVEVRVLSSAPFDSVAHIPAPSLMASHRCVDRGEWCPERARSESKGNLCPCLSIEVERRLSRRSCGPASPKLDERRREEGVTPNHSEGGPQPSLCRGSVCLGTRRSPLFRTNHETRVKDGPFRAPPASFSPSGGTRAMGCEVG